jgi:hypothetical protein
VTGRTFSLIPSQRAWRQLAASAGLVAILGASLGGHASAAGQAGTLVLDAGGMLTASATVQAVISTADGSTPSEVRLANSATVVDGRLQDGETLPWTGSIAWSLDAAPCPCADGERTVWAQWRTAGGPWSEIVSDTITLDRTAPTGTVVIDGGAQYMGDPWGWEGPAYTFPSVMLTITVGDAGPNLPPQAWAVSRDGATWEQYPLEAYGTFELDYELVRSDVDEGVKTVWARWQDAAGNWSAPATDTIVLRYEQAGRVIVGDGSGYVDSFVVPVRVPVDVVPPEGVASVWVSSNYLGCDNQPYDRECMARKYTWAPGMVISWDIWKTTSFLAIMILASSVWDLATCPSSASTLSSMSLSPSVLLYHIQFWGKRCINSRLCSVNRLFFEE